MDKAITDEIVVWTARISIACYLTWAVTAILRTRERAFRGLLPCLYAAGWVLMTVHVAAAFAYVHGWSHAAAYEHTARKTAAVTGIDWGGGLFFNYLLLIVWGADVVWRFFAQKPRSTPPGAWNMFVQAYLIFMIFNATVVFGPTGWIWTAAGVAALIGAAALVRARRQSP